MVSELQHCHVAVRQHSGISSESEAGLSVGTSMVLAPECGLTFRGNVCAEGMHVRFRKSLFNTRSTPVHSCFKSSSFLISAV